MSSILLRTVVVAILIGMVPTYAPAKEIRPKESQYIFATEENDDVRICEITLDIENYANPKIVEIIAFAGYGKSEGSVGIGFIIKATKTGPAGEFSQISLSEATFASDSFLSSRDMEYELRGDYGIMAATLKSKAGRDFLKAFTDGSFRISLTLPGHKEAKN